MTVKVTKKIEEKSVLEAILKNAADIVKSDAIGIVVSSKEFLSGIDGTKAKQKVTEILKNYDYVFSINGGPLLDDAKKIKQQLLNYFKNVFGADVPVSILKIGDDYTVFSPLAFKITFFDQSK